MSKSRLGSLIHLPELAEIRAEPHSVCFRLETLFRVCEQELMQSHPHYWPDKTPHKIREYRNKLILNLMLQKILAAKIATLQSL